MPRAPIAAKRSLPRTRMLLVGVAGCVGVLPAQGQTGVNTPGAPITRGTNPSQGAASIAGTVVDSGGAMIAGARVQAVSGSVQAETTSDTDGRFSVGGLPPGSVHLVITLPGFVTAEDNEGLQPGQSLQLAPVVLTLATVNIEVNAITEEQLALEELHTEEHQRLAGVLPNFFVSYNWTARPLSARQKFTLATHTVLDPGNLALAGTVAGVQQAANAFPGYGQGAAGYGKRYGADLGNLVIGTYMGGAVLPSLFRQDPRYFFKGTGTVRSRAVYAISRAVICRGDNGRPEPNLAGVLGDLSSGAISNLYYPASDRQGATLTLENGLLAIAGDAMNNLVQEFVLNRLTTRGRNRAGSAGEPAGSGAP